MLVHPFKELNFGCLIDFEGCDFEQFVCDLEDDCESLLSEFYRYRGLMVLRGVNVISRSPQLLVRLSHIFGHEVENYHTTITTPQFFHESEAEILVLSNHPPCNFAPPDPPCPPLTAEDRLPIQYPHRMGWHTDQGYRRPPPDISLLYAVRCPPMDQGQTLYADGFGAYASLDDEIKSRIEDIEGIHTIRWVGRSALEVRNLDAVKTLEPNQLPQRQPVVRRHPVTGQRALYLCDEGQMDFIDGPLIGLSSGLNGEGAMLLDQLMRHLTSPEHVYVHHWRPGDLVIHDNRNMPHTATWYDAEKYERLMWRTTVFGNPGSEYQGETRSWVREDGEAAMKGLEDLEF